VEIPEEAAKSHVVTTSKLQKFSCRYVFNMSTS